MAYETTRTFQYPRDRAGALQDLRQGLAEIGTVDRVSERTSTVYGHCRVRRPWPMTVKFRAAVMGGPDGESVVEVNAYGSDIWAYGARQGLATLESALEALPAVGPA